MKGRIIMNISYALNRIAAPYLLSGSNIVTGATYDAEACKAIESYLENMMEHDYFSCSVSYCDYCVTSRRIEGVMTITCVGDDYVPQVFTVIYERKNG